MGILVFWVLGGLYLNIRNVNVIKYALVTQLCVYQVYEGKTYRNIIRENSRNSWDFADKLALIVSRCDINYSTGNMCCDSNWDLTRRFAPFFVGFQLSYR